MEKVVLKHYCNLHLFSQFITSNSEIIKNVISDYIFVKGLAKPDGEVTAIIYKHKSYAKEYLVMKFL